MKPVTDPDLLAALNAPEPQAQPQGPQPVTDPELLRQLNARDFGINWQQPIAQVRAAISRLPEQDRHEALQQWADEYVRQERKTERGRQLPEGPLGAGAIDPSRAATALREMGRGTIVGPWLDEAVAGGNALLSHVTGGRVGMPYEESVALERARNRAADAELGGQGTALQVVGGLGGGGLTYAAARRLGLPALTASTIPRQSLIGAGVGAAAAGNYAAGTSEGTPDERLAAATDTGTLATGAGIGAALPPAVGAANAFLVRPVYNYVSPTIARWAENVRGLPERLGIRLSADGSIPDSPGAIAAARQVIANRAVQAGATPEELRQALDQAERSSLYHGGGERGGPGASYAPNAQMLIEANPAFQRLGSSAMRASEEAANVGSTRLRARQTGLTPGTEAEQRLLEGSGLPTREPMTRPNPSATPAGQGERLLDAFRRGMLVSDRDYHQHLATGRRTADQIVNQAEQDARTAYDAAYKAGENLNMADVVASAAPNIARLIENEAPRVQARVQRLLNLFSSARNLEQFDRIKRSELDPLIDRLLKNPNHYNSAEARVLSQVKEALLGATENAGQAGTLYKTARDEFSSRMEMRDAYEAGRKLFQSTSDNAIEQLAAMGGIKEGERSGAAKMLQLGAYDSAREAMETMRTGNDRLSVFDSPRARAILSYLIPRTETPTGRIKIVGGAPAEFSDRPQRFGRYIQNEQNMIATRNEAVGNSKTAQRLADDEAYRALNTIAEVFHATGSPTAVALKLGEKAVQAVFGMRQDTSAAIARQLFTADPLQRRQNLEAIIARMGANRAQQLAMYLQRHQAQLTAGAVRGAPQELP